MAIPKADLMDGETWLSMLQIPLYYLNKSSVRILLNQAFHFWFAELQKNKKANKKQMVNNSNKETVLSTFYCYLMVIWIFAAYVGSPNVNTQRLFSWLQNV